MARKARVEFDGALYHVLDRGDRREELRRGWCLGAQVFASGPGQDSEIMKLTPFPFFLSDYDGMGRLEKIQAASDGSTDYQYWYDAASNVTERNIYFFGANVSYFYDNLNRMTERDINVPTSQIPRGWFSKEHYGFDTMNRLTRILRSESGYTDTLGYNLAGEVTSANYAFSGRSITYTIDKAGNRTRVIDGGVTKNYTSNSINQYTAIGGVVPVYIGGHALQSYGTQTCYYIAGTYLVKAVNGSNTLLLYYDALGRCVKQTLNGVTTYHIFDGDHWILENNASDVNTITVLYGREMDEVIAVSNNGTPYFYFPDRNGNISAVLNLAGGVAEFYRYDRFGLPTFYGPAGGMLTGTQIGNRFLFTGREWDAGVGLYEYRHRGYNPVLGRFMSEDPKGFDAGDYNLYRYCGNDPLDLSDPMGMQPEGAWQPPVMPHPFISTIVEGAGTVGAQQPRINVQGRNSQMQIPTKRYDTPWRAGLEAVGDGQYDSAKSEHFQREFNFPLAQVNGVAEGEYFHGGLLAGVGVSGPGQKYSGWQVSYIERLADYIPIGSHLVGYATIHPHFDPGTVSKVDLPNFERGFHIPAHILLKAPFNFNSDTPRTQYIVGTCKYCNQ